MSKITTFSLIFVGIGILSITNFSSAKNLEGSESGFCFKQIPRKSVAANCSSNEYCQKLDVASTYNFAKCGMSGECVVEEILERELCKDACKTSPCGKLCVQEYETKVAKYCIKTRDHLNSIPNYVLQPNLYHCVCVVPSYFSNSKLKLN